MSPLSPFSLEDVCSSSSREEAGARIILEMGEEIVASAAQNSVSYHAKFSRALAQASEWAHSFSFMIL